MTKDNCCTCGYDEWAESFQINAADDSGNPPASVASLITEVTAKDWADLSGLAWQTGGLLFGNRAFRGEFRTAPSSSYLEITGGPGSLPLGISTASVATVPGASGHTMFKTAAGYEEEFGGCQSSGWIWVPEAVVDCGGVVHPKLSRCRSKRRTSSTAFVVNVEVWAYDWFLFTSCRSAGGTILLYPTLAVDTFSLAAGEWYEPPFPSASATHVFHDGTGADDPDEGGIGQIGNFNCVVRWESKADWQTRTGITL